MKARFSTILVLLMVVALAGLGAQPANAASALVKVYSGFVVDNVNKTSGTPYSDYVGSVTSDDVLFGTNTTWNWHPLDQKGFGAEISGYIQVAQSGSYQFTLNSDDGSTLFLNGQQILSNGGLHNPQIARTSVTLGAGVYPFVIHFFEDGTGLSGLDLTLPAGVSYAEISDQTPDQPSNPLPEPPAGVSYTSHDLLWVSADGAASIWTLDSSDNFTSLVFYGPYSGWTPLFYNRNINGTATLVWVSTTGAVGIWSLDSSNNYTSSVTYGPYSGWTPVSYEKHLDGTATLLWGSTNGAASIWTLNASTNNYLSAVQYGPYSGWTPLSYNRNPDGTATLLWRSTTGEAAVWTLDSSDNFTSFVSYGPYGGWMPVSYERSFDGTAKFFWVSTAGAAAIWTLDSSDNFTGLVSYGPYSGWMPVSYERNFDGTAKLFWVSTTGAAGIWSLDSSDNFTNVVSYGPYSGWTAQDYE